MLCANVLPVIPDPKVRARALRLLAERLHPQGHCLFVVQYRNSYFKTISQFPGAKYHLDGWLVPRDQNATSYFGILPPNRLQQIVTRQGFTVLQAWVEEQSAYVLCGVQKAKTR